MSRYKPSDAFVIHPKSRTTEQFSIQKRRCAISLGEMCHSCHQLISLHVIYEAHSFSVVFQFLSVSFFGRTLFFSLFPFKCVLSLHLHCSMEHSLHEIMIGALFTLTMSCEMMDGIVLDSLNKRNEHLWNVLCAINWMELNRSWPFS